MKNIYKHMQNLDTKDVIEGLFNGRFPVKKQGAASGEQDYYFYEPEQWDLMISNPPFTNKKMIFERAIDFNKPFCLLMTLTWLNDRAPMRLFRDKGLQLLMFEDRMQFKNQSKIKPINFSSAYFCRDFLPEQILIRDFKSFNQRSLF